MIKKLNIDTGTFDNVKNTVYAIPSYWDIGKVYKCLVLGVSKEEGIEIV
ncbi:MAG: hypothetical protein ACK5LT_11000 [Lachnospirales bacterium]